MITGKRVVLFQGDSITDGARGRNDDPNHILGHSYAYVVGARLGCEWAEQQPVFINRGISGNRISDLYARWNEDAISVLDEACGRADASYWLWDGVHPTPAGHELIARQWLKIVLNSKLADI